LASSFPFSPVSSTFYGTYPPLWLHSVQYLWLAFPCLLPSILQGMRLSTSILQAFPFQPIRTATQLFFLHVAAMFSLSSAFTRLYFLGDRPPGPPSSDRVCYPARWSCSPTFRFFFSGVFFVFFFSLDVFFAMPSCGIHFPFPPLSPVQPGTEILSLPRPNQMSPPVYVS